MTDNVSVYAGEIAAIRIALHAVGKIENDKPVSVFSDSLSAIRSIETERSNSRPTLLRDTLTHALQKQVSLVWVPSHIGIHGNEMADQLACEGAKKPAVDIDIGLELTEVYSVVDDYCKSKWQHEWSEKIHGH